MCVYRTKARILAHANEQAITLPLSIATAQDGTQVTDVATMLDSILIHASNSSDDLAEARDALLAHLATRPDYAVEGTRATRPDGVTVETADGPPLLVAGRCVREDLCLMERGSQERGPREYVLTAAVLCFPSRWRLAEKIGRPLTAIHAPVPTYDDDLARRVNRIFEGLRAGRPLWRANVTVHDSDALHQPEAAPPEGDRLWVRVERQTFVRLPRTGAVVFGIRTLQRPLEALAPAEAAGLRAYLAGHGAAEVAYHAGGAALHARALARLAAVAA